jgi:uncharacterized UPF0146 family protein
MLCRSGGFVVDELGEFAVKMNDKNSKLSLVKVEIKQEFATTWIKLKADDASKPPYRIVNNTSFILALRQKVSECFIELNCLTLS